MFVKICGITNEEDALFCVAMGVDAVGFVFAPSTRQVLAAGVEKITSRLPGEILTIGVFRDSLPERVIDVVSAAGLQGVQLHGNETPEEIAAIRPHVHFLIKAFPAGSPLLARALEYQADALLVDAAEPGSGQIFDWKIVEGVPRTNRLVLAGGLTPANVGEAISLVRPFGVDVNSGVERAPGHKDPRKVREFVAAARAASDRLESETVVAPLHDERLYDWQEEE